MDPPKDLSFVDVLDVLDFQGNMYMVYMGMFEEISTSFFRHFFQLNEIRSFFFVRTSMRYTHTLVCVFKLFFFPIFHQYFTI